MGEWVISHLYRPDVITPSIGLSEYDVELVEDTGAGVPAAGPRTIVLACRSRRRRAHLQALRLEIEKVCTPGAALRIYYVGAAQTLQLRAQFMPQPGDLDRGGDRLLLRFVAADPLWSYPLEDDGVFTALAPVATVASANYIVRRRPTGAWQGLATGMNGQINALLAAGSAVYVGGAFSSPGTRTAQWTGSAWLPLGAGCNGDVNALALGADGSVYAGGAFTSPASRVARWSGSAWAALGAGLAGTVHALALLADGSLVAGGASIGSGQYLQRWSGASWAALGTGPNGTVFALAVGPDGMLYAGGDFTAPGSRIAAYKDGSWSALGSGLNGTCFALAIGADGSVYAGGAFTTAGGVPAPRIARWNGSSWSALGGGLSADVLALAVDAAGVVYAGGAFLVAGGLPLADRIARWNGATWLPVDIDLPGTSSVRALCAAPDNTLYVGFAAAGTATAAGLTTVQNIGTAATSALLYLYGPGQIFELVNFTTGASIFFSLALLAGERVTLDLGPLTCVSDQRGNLVSALVPGSQLSHWQLEPGPNTIGLLYTGATAALPADLQYHPRFWSLDNADV